jgi:1-acyl-sn-glycerol-3-phosphate acyltransferase
MSTVDAKLRTRQQLYLSAFWFGISFLWGSFLAVVLPFIIPIDRAQRDDRVLRAHIERCLHAGGSLILFPEGRFGYGEHQPSSFHKGFAHFAKQAGVPVIPVALSGTRDLWVRRHLRVHIGAPLHPHDHSIDSLTAAAESRVRALLPPVSWGRGPRLLRRRLTNLFL